MYVICVSGMLALEMLGRRAHNDHPNNFSRSPPYTEDVKWLLGLAARLGESGHQSQALVVAVGGEVIAHVHAHGSFSLL